MKTIHTVLREDFGRLDRNLVRSELLSERGVHGVSFETAGLAFFDPNALVIDDPDHSHEEERFILLGRSLHGVLVVCHCYRARAIRIISARQANAWELRQYLEGLN